MLKSSMRSTARFPDHLDAHAKARLHGELRNFLNDGLPRQVRAQHRALHVQMALLGLVKFQGVVVFGCKAQMRSPQRVTWKHLNGDSYSGQFNLSLSDLRVLSTFGHASDSDPEVRFCRPGPAKRRRDQ